MTLAETCAATHEALVRLPLRTRPDEVSLRDGLYFFYERGEVSRHGCPRVVRVGNRRRSKGRLVGRLHEHYMGDKSGSVFRRCECARRWRSSATTSFLVRQAVACLHHLRPQGPRRAQPRETARSYPSFDRAEGPPRPRPSCWGHGLTCRRPRWA